MADVTALRYFVTDSETEDSEERDALLSVEVGDPESERGINLHISPRTNDVVMTMLSADEAWRLARELARAAADLEQGA